MDRMEFTQGVTSTRVLENRLLATSTIEKMVDAKDIDEVLRTLGDTEYSAAVSAASKADDYEEILSYELKRVYELIREISPKDEVVDLMALKYDFHNIKVMLKEKFIEKDLSDLYIDIGTIDFNKLKSFFIAGDLKSIDPKFSKPIEAVIKDFEETKDPQRIDIVLDRYYYSELYSLAEETGIDLFIEYVKDSIDFLNVSTVIRLKKQGKDARFFKDIVLENGNIDKEEMLQSINDTLDVMMTKFKNVKISSELIKGLEDYQQTGRLSAFEKNMDNYLMSLNKPSKSVVFGPEPLFSYLVAKEMEIKIIRIIMVSKINNLSPQATRERLRDLYV